MYYRCNNCRQLLSIIDKNEHTRDYDLNLFDRITKTMPFAKVVFVTCSYYQF